MLGRIALIIRSAGALMDNDARELLAEALDDAQREIDNYFGATE